MSDETRFERQLIPNNILDQLQNLAAETRITLEQVALTTASIDRSVHGVVGTDPMYSLHFMFSTTSGRSFSESPEIIDDLNYHVRFEISQLHGERQLSAFGLQWVLPGGWQWVDGLPDITYEEAVSNPLQITRVARSPVGAVNTVDGNAFQCIVFEEFPS